MLSTGEPAYLLPLTHLHVAWQMLVCHRNLLLAAKQVIAATGHEQQTFILLAREGLHYAPPDIQDSRRLIYDIRAEVLCVAFVELAVSVSYHLWLHYSTSCRAAFPSPIWEGRSIEDYNEQGYMHNAL